MPGSAVRPRITPQRNTVPSRLSLRPRQRALDAAREALRKRPAAAGSRGESLPPAAGEAQTVLIAGHDPARRADVLDQLARTMPGSTRFEEAGSFWEVLVQAPSSQMVIISGELDDGPPESLRHTLARRHPDLPVVSFAARALATH
jgi:hypothetical protein